MFESIRAMFELAFYKKKFNLDDALSSFKKAQDELTIGIEEMCSEMCDRFDRIGDVEVERELQIEKAKQAAKEKIEAEETAISDLEDDISEARQWLDMMPKRKSTE